jgi:hypothetical protein
MDRQEFENEELKKLTEAHQYGRSSRKHPYGQTIIPNFQCLQQEYQR